MAIVQNLTEDPGDGSYTFPNTGNADNLFVIGIDEGKWIAPRISHIFPGVAGAKHYVDNRKERLLTVDVQLYDYVSLAALNTDHANMESLTHGPYGLLEVDGSSYGLCTFDGVVPLTRRQFDGSGAHGWTRKFRLSWIQRSY